MKLISKIHIVTLLIIQLAVAQWLQYQPDSPIGSQPILQDSVHHQLNFYNHGENIAALFFDEKAFSLWTGGSLQMHSGAFHTPFLPSSSNQQQYSVRLVKPLTARHIFKGYFGFQRLEDRQVLWIHQSRQLETNPFLLGDSSTGNFVLNGIFWNGEWSYALNKSSYFGIGIYYNVDRRLKQNFPKPENQHRDIHLRTGLQKNWKSTQTGLSFRYFDEQEKVEISRYNLNQNLTPELYKFRFSDLPVLLLGKTSEERLLDYRGFEINLHFSQKIASKLTLMGIGAYSHSRGETVDGGSQPQDQGLFNRNDWTGEAILDASFSSSLSGRITYHFSHRNLNAEPPEFELIAIKHPLWVNQLIISLKDKIRRRSVLTADLVYQNTFERYQDLMTINQYQYEYQILGIKVGWQNRLTTRWEYLWWGRTFYYFLSDHSRTDNRYTEFFDNLFIKKYEYFSNHALDWATGIQLIYHYGPIGDMELTMIFDQSIPTSNFPDSATRHCFILNMMIKFFII